MSPIAPNRVTEADILTETGRLLRNVSFTADRGGFSEGRHVAVWIEPRVNEDSGERYVFVGCHAPLHIDMNWQGTPIFLCRQDTHDLEDIWLLNRQGAASGSVAVGQEYYLSTSPTHAVSAPAPVADDERAAAWAFRGEFVMRGAPAPRVEKVSSADGRVEALIVDRGAGTKNIKFETSDAELVGHKVRFAFRDQAGDILQNGSSDVTLVSAGSWTPVQLRRPEPVATLVFEVWQR